MKIKRMELESEKSVEVLTKTEKKELKSRTKAEKKEKKVISKEGKPKKKVTKTAVLSALIMLVICGLMVGSVVYYLSQNSDSDSEDTTTSAFAGMEFSEDAVSATGTTSIGVLSEEFEPDYITSSLYIEEVYLSTGDEIQEGTAILKISDDSIEAAREELSQTLIEATLAYRAGSIQFEQSKITAQYDYDVSVLEGTQAEEVYQETLESLETELANAEEEVATVEAQIAEYTTALETDSYYTEYQVAQKLATYNSNLALLEKKVGEWGIPYSAFMSGSQMGGSSSYDKWQVSTLSLLYAELDENLTEYEKALEDYENAVDDATLQIKQLNLSLKTLKENLAETQANYETKKISALTTYNTALAKSEMASSDYDTAIKKAEEEFNTLENAKEDAEDNLNEFEELLGDGYLYTTSSGTIIMVTVNAEENLQGASTVLAYSNTDEITIAVTVEQADISKIAIGDSALVNISDYGNYSGIVTEINPISESTSRTSITYDVTVTLDNTDSSLTSNLTADVYFNMGGQAE